MLIAISMKKKHILWRKRSLALKFAVLVGGISRELSEKPQTVAVVIISAVLCNSGKIQVGRYQQPYHFHHALTNYILMIGYAEGFFIYLAEMSCRDKVLPAKSFG